MRDTFERRLRLFVGGIAAVVVLLVGGSGAVLVQTKVGLDD